MLFIASSGCVIASTFLHAIIEYYIMPQNMRNIIKVQLHFIEFCIPCKFWIVSQCELFTEWIVVSFSFIFCYCSAAVLCRRKTNDRAKLLGWNHSPLLFPETLIDSSCHGSSKKMVFLLFFFLFLTHSTDSWEPFLKSFTSTNWFLFLDVFAPNFWKPQPYKTIVAQLEQWKWDLQMQMQTLQRWA